MIQAMSKVSWANVHVDVYDQRAIAQLTPEFRYRRAFAGHLYAGAVSSGRRPAELAYRL